MWKSRMVFMLLGGVFFPGSAWAYHPLATEDPGTTAPGHFQLEWGNAFILPDGTMKEVNGYLQLFSGLAPRLELDIALNFVYQQHQTEGPGRDFLTRGLGDLGMLLKYRLLGEDEEPYALGIDLGVLFPSGEEEVGHGGEGLKPWALVFARAGRGPVRFMMNLGANFESSENATMIYSGALELALVEEFLLAVEGCGATDWRSGGGNDPVHIGAGAVWGLTGWLGLSLGGHFGMNEDAERFSLTAATNFSW